jgi:hypothetical protein
VNQALTNIFKSELKENILSILLQGDHNKTEPTIRLGNF